MNLLRERGAATLDHPGGDLLSHLIRTGQRLARWDAPAALVAAGQWHAAYGTDGFPTALFTLAERQVVAGAIGGEAETIVYRYGSCDRRFVYPLIGHQSPVEFRDRFTGAVDLVPERDVRAFVELTVANELDVVDHSETFRREHGPQMVSLFASWSSLLSPAACADMRATLGLPAAGAS
jgi:hypothetical protein